MSDTYYHFFPVLRHGLAAAIDAAATGHRAEIPIHLHPNARVQASDQWLDPPPVERRVQLYGPGDVIGLDERIVARTDPKPDAGNFEPDYFPAIEFTDPDFLWRCTPDRYTAEGLAPWVTLIVLIGEDQGDDVRREYDEVPRRPQQTPTILVKQQDSLPDLQYAWRWAHVQVTKDDGVPDEAGVAAMLEEQPECLVSRLVCPRRLLPQTSYTAFVVPTFKLGVVAVLEELRDPALTAGDFAWDAARSDPVELPYYYRWSFRTSARGDFEYLVRLLEPRKLERIGKRKIDCERPGFGLRVTVGGVDPDDAHRLEMEGALQSIDTVYTAWGKDRDGPLPPSGPLPPMPDPEEFQIQAADRLFNKESADRATVEVPYDLASTRLETLEFDVLDDGQTVRVQWSTASATTGRFEYGDEDDAGAFGYTDVRLSNTPTRQHAVEATLIPERVYHFRLVVTDTGGVETATPDATLLVPLPTVTPPLYGRWHAARTEVVAHRDSNGWFDWMNLDPRHRAAAGAGADVVRTEQEAMMASAWDQLGAVEAANDVLRRAQMGRDASCMLHHRFGLMALEDELRLTAPAQKRISRDAPAGARITVPAELAECTRMCRAALGPPFRRLARPRGALRRRQWGTPGSDVTPTRPMDVLRRLDAGTLAAAGPHRRPTGTRSPASVTRHLVVTRLLGGVDPGITTPGVGATAMAVSGGPIGTPIAVVDVPDNAKRFYDDRLTVAQLPTALPDMLVEETETLTAVRATFTTFLRPSDTVDTRPTHDGEYLEDLRAHVHRALDPRVTIRHRTHRRVRLVGPAAERFADAYRGDPLDEVMAYPEFPQPMYEPLRDRSQHLILPGIETIPQNTIGLLETNGRFVESYMVGLNHEFAGELLWRRYPTDQRGSYFRQFWDVREYVPREDPDPALSETDEHGALKDTVKEALKDIRPIHLWDDTPLGRNDNRRDSDRGEQLVLVVRGDLLKRYPNAVIYAVDATDDGRLPKLAEFGGEVARPEYPLFRGTLGADLTFLGFSFSADEAKSAPGLGGKFFVLEERVSEARFGLDAAEVSEAVTTLPSWNDLSWAHLQLAETEHAGRYVDEFAGTIALEGGGGPVWSPDASAAARARITLQKPVRIAIHANQMIPSD